MGYDIPDKVRYREKIVFGLDAKQLIYSVFFGFAALLSYNLPLNGEIKFIAPSIIVILGIATVFFQFDSMVNELWAYYQVSKLAKKPAKLAKVLYPIKGYEKSCIVLQNNELRSVLKVSPVNFSLFDDDRKNMLIGNYRDFLNHLGQEVQFVVRTRRATLQQYYEHYEKLAQGIKEGGLTGLYGEFKAHETAFLEKNSVNEREYYLIVCLRPEPKEDSFQKLDERTQIIREKLFDCGIESVRLQGPFLKKFMQSKINSLELSPNSVRINGVYHSIFQAAGYPRMVENGWLQAFMSRNDAYDISVHIAPASVNRMLEFLHNQIIRQTSDLISSTSKGTPNPSLEIKLGDTKKLHDALYKGEEKLFRVSLYIDNKASDMKSLNLLLEKCRANMDSLLIIPKPVKYNVVNGLVSCLPLGIDKLSAQREFPTSSLAATFPFLSTSSADKTGILFGHEETSLNPIFLDFESMPNKHFFVLGISGSGKSYTAKYLIMQALFSENPRVYIIDPNAEYAGMCSSLGGGTIEISRTSESCINVFGLNGQSLGDKLLTLITVFDIITGGLSEAQKGVLNEVLPKAYTNKGIFQDDPESWSNTPPTFTDIRRELRDLHQSYMKRGGRTSMDIRRSIEVLINRVEMYVEGGFFGFLDRQTKIDMQNRFLNFDLSNLPAAVKPLVMFSVMDFLSNEIRKDHKPKMLLIDEGWALLSSKEAENYLFEFVKTSRKFGASIGFITQEIEDLFGSEGGRSILNMASTKIIMRQSSSNIELIRKNMRLNANEIEYLLRCRKGYGLLITEKGHFKFFTTAPEGIHSLLTTDPNEVSGQDRKMQLEEMQEKKEKTRLVLEDKTKTLNEIKEAREKSQLFEPTDSWYSAKGLDENQKKQLLGLGFVEIKTTKHGKGGETHFLVKPRTNESPLHHFICKVIEEDLKPYATEIQLKETQEPDVVAKINGKTVAFEVETGTWLKQNQGIVKEKFERVRKNYPISSIVVADWRLQNKYKHLGKVITRQELSGAIKRIVEQLADK